MSDWTDWTQNRRIADAEEALDAERRARSRLSEQMRQQQGNLQGRLDRLTRAMVALIEHEDIRAEPGPARRRGGLPALRPRGGGDRGGHRRWSGARDGRAGRRARLLARGRRAGRGRRGRRRDLGRGPARGRGPAGPGPRRALPHPADGAHPGPALGRRALRAGRSRPGPGHPGAAPGLAGRRRRPDRPRRAGAGRRAHPPGGRR
ncbi:hypothetical protein [Nocardioides convexus]|uniref:hypothetical protein n=1 Tax=Nocardioides convexus TaxID=2712224 RepID=UPI0024183322|nr:hypothetical protein [Nocardioides convexus]